MESKTPLSQIAYAVTDVREFAAQHARTFGSGPFLMMEGFQVDCLIRGEEVTFTVDVAFGQWDDVQVEVMQQTSPGLGLIHGLYAPEGQVRTGVHHICNLVEDVDAAVAGFEAAGYETVFSCTMPGGTKAVMIDTVASLGHFTELYEYTDEMRGLYEPVRAAAVGWDGSDPVRPMVLF